MTTVHRIGAAVVIIVGSHGYGKAELIRMAMRASHPTTVLTLDSGSKQSLETILQCERYITPLLPAVLHRREWLNALLARDARQYLDRRQAQLLIQRRGSLPTPSWTAAMRARRHQSNNLVTKPAW